MTKEKFMYFSEEKMHLLKHILEQEDENYDKLFIVGKQKAIEKFLEYKNI